MMKHFQQSVIAAFVAAILVSSLVGCKKDEPQGGSGDSTLILSQTSLELSQGGTAMLTASYSPSGAVLSWGSDNEALVTVDGGLVTAVGENGTATITASLIDLSNFSVKATATCAVTVNTVFITGISLPSELPLSMGTSYQLQPGITPPAAAGVGLRYEVTEGGQYVEVSADGLLTPIAVTGGSAYATVKVTSKDSKGVSTTVKVTVGEKPIYPTNASLKDFSEEISVGKQFFATLSYTPSSATWKVFTVSSNNTAVATVEKWSDGIRVTGKSAGSATITVTWEGENSVKHDIVKNLTVHASEPSIAWTTDMAATFGQGLIVGESKTATASVSNLNNKSVVYSSSNPSIATVGETNGVVAAKSSGWFTITATSAVNGRVMVTSESIRVYGKPATIYVSANVDEGWFIRYQTSKTMNVQIRDANGQASRQDLLRFSIATSGLGLSYSLTSASSDMMTLTVTGTRTSATSTLKGSAKLYVQGYNGVQKAFDIYDSMYDEYDIKPFDGLYPASNGMKVYDGGYRGSGYFAYDTPPTGAFRTKSTALIVYVGDRPSAKSALGSLPGLSRYEAPAQSGIHGLAVSKANAADGKWWTNSSPNSGDEVLRSSHYTGYWSGGTSSPMYVSTTNNDGYGYEICTAMASYNGKVSADKWKVQPVLALSGLSSTGSDNSGWYVPTSAEWAKMLKSMGDDVAPATVAQQLTVWMKAMTDGEGIYSTNNYWSCQEASVNSWNTAVYMTGISATAAGGTPQKTQSKTSTAKTRPFLAF
ncbi:MAG: Ig-like domain-containing protein [Bacteroidales bacterium]|nr:Ig-like domain-containing protein [Bacteroidales bacterium]